MNVYVSGYVKKKVHAIVLKSSKTNVQDILQENERRLDKEFGIKEESFMVHWGRKAYELNHGRANSLHIWVHDEDDEDEDDYDDDESDGEDKESSWIESGQNCDYAVSYFHMLDGYQNNKLFMSNSKAETIQHLRDMEIEFKKLIEGSLYEYPAHVFVRVLDDVKMAKLFNQIEDDPLYDIMAIRMELENPETVEANMERAKGDAKIEKWEKKLAMAKDELEAATKRKQYVEDKLLEYREKRQKLA